MESEEFTRTFFPPRRNYFHKKFVRLPKKKKIPFEFAFFFSPVSRTLLSSTSRWVVETRRSRPSPGPRTRESRQAPAKVTPLREKRGEGNEFIFFCKPSRPPPPPLPPLSLSTFYFSHRLTPPHPLLPAPTKNKTQAPASRTTPRPSPSSARSAAPPSSAPRPRSTSSSTSQQAHERVTFEQCFPGFEEQKK